MRTNRFLKWEKKLKTIFDEIDVELEHLYRDRFKLHPNRSHEGSTASPHMDGLFNVGAAYSAGFGSTWGPGYVVDIRVSTLEKVPDEIALEMRDTVQTLLIKKLPTIFPNKELHVDKEKNYLRIHGDLSVDNE